MDAALEDIVTKASALSQRCMLAMGQRGTRAPYLLRGQSVFALGTTSVQKLTFNVPADADFNGERLNLYLQYRIIDVVTVAASDTAYRPCRWSSQADLNRGIVGFPESNAMVSLKDEANGEYQNAPFNVGCLYSSMYGVTSSSLGGVVGEYFGGLDFNVPYVVPCGKAAEMDVTPLYTSALGVTSATSYMTATQRVEFRVVGMFHGYKNVRAFR
jgi:hypothetical protein